MTMKKNSKTRRGATDRVAAGLSSSPATGGAKRNARTVRMPPPKDAAVALARLRTGNRRFVAGKLRHAHEAASWRAPPEAGAAPVRDDPGVQ